MCWTHCHRSLAADQTVGLAGTKEECVGSGTALLGQLEARETLTTHTES